MASPSTIFPIILSSFDCQVVALNRPPGSEELTRDKYEFEYSMKQLAHIVTSLSTISDSYRTARERLFL